MSGLRRFQIIIGRKGKRFQSVAVAQRQVTSVYSKFAPKNHNFTTLTAGPGRLICTMPRKSKHDDDDEPEERPEPDEEKLLDDDDMPLDAADSGALSSSLQAAADDEEFDEDDFDDDFDDDFEQELDDELNEDLGEFDEKIEGEGDDDDVPLDEVEDF